VLPLLLAEPSGATLSILAVGAHPDDIELGAGGTLLKLAEANRRLRVCYVLLTGTPERQAEARKAASAFCWSAEITTELHGLPEGRLPTHFQRVKDLLESIGRSFSPDVVLAPSLEDAHQDHRTVAEIVPTVFRDHLYLAYEIPKWDGDLSRPSVYVPLPEETVSRKVELLHKCFPSQRHRQWWDDDVFLGLARLRGVECRARYAEAFRCGKAVLALDAR
jgi:LmbE family N-acetylglucosaminyl deacetylase